MSSKNLELSQYIFLPSNGDTNLIFRNNNISSYTTPLAVPLEFTDGIWEVGVSEAFIPNYIYNIWPPHNEIYINGFPEYCRSFAHAPEMVKLVIPPGRYTPKMFVEAVNSILRGFKLTYKTRLGRKLAKEQRRRDKDLATKIADEQRALDLGNKDVESHFGDILSEALASRENPALSDGIGKTVVAAETPMEEDIEEPTMGVSTGEAATGGGLTAEELERLWTMPLESSEVTVTEAIVPEDDDDVPWYLTFGVPVGDDFGGQEPPAAPQRVSQAERLRLKEERRRARVARFRARDGIQPESASEPVSAVTGVDSGRAQKRSVVEEEPAVEEQQDAPILEKTETFHGYLALHANSQKLSFHLKKKEVILIPSTKLRQMLGFDGKDAAILENKRGAAQSTTLPYPINLDMYLQHIHIYTNIVEPTLIGDGEAPLVRIVSGVGTTEGTLIYKEYTAPQYFRVANRTIKQIEIKITNSIGEDLRIQSGQVLIVLNFVRRKKY